MITENDLKQAILECQGERNPNANTCIKLAAYLTILESLYPKEDKSTPEPIKAQKAANNNDLIGDLGDTDFYRMIQGKKYTDVLAVVNELMDTVYIMNPKLYDGVMHELMKSG